jgi:ArsR family transcriptional regulator
MSGINRLFAGWRSISTCPRYISRGPILNALSHPHRVRIVEEPRDRELDVNSLRQSPGISPSSVSQSLALLRPSHLVLERRDGRRMMYCLTAPVLAAWLMNGIPLLEGHITNTEKVLPVVDGDKDPWGSQTGG